MRRSLCFRPDGPDLLLSSYATVVFLLKMERDDRTVQRMLLLSWGNVRGGGTVCECYEMYDLRGRLIDVLRSLLVMTNWEFD